MGTPAYQPPPRPPPGHTPIAPGVYIDSRRIRPHWWPVAFAALPALAGLAVAVVIGVHFFTNFFGTSIHHFDTSGSTVVHLDKDAHRTVYLQTKSDGSSLQGTRPATDQLSCAAHGVSSGKNLDLSRTTEDLTLTRNDDTYKGRFQTAHAPAADDYRFTCRYEPNPERRFPMAVGPYLSVGTIVKAIGIALGSLLVGFLLAGAIVALVALRRQRSRRLLVNEAMARHRTGVGQPGSPG